LIWIALIGSVLTSRGRLVAQPFAAVASPEDQIVALSATVLDEVMMIPVNSIPRTLLGNAHAVAIIPNVVKGGFVVGLRHGRGVLLIRDAGQWQAPRFVTLTSGSVGWQAGLQATDLIMVFQTRQSVNALLGGRLTVGVDAAAAAGPVGRQATAATDTSLSAEILSYSRSRGLFAGFALDGASIQIDNLAAARFYRPDAAGQVTVPPSAAALVERLTRYAGAVTPAMASGPIVDDSAAVEQVRQHLLVAWQRLAGLLDVRWREYLQLPNDLIEGSRLPDSSIVTLTVNRYDAVAADPRYATLSQRPEYVAVHGLLRQYASLQSRQAATTLSLPPPPRQ
jgi:lipid-binding SYLF domain-containing protein